MKTMFIFLIRQLSVFSALILFIISCGDPSTNITIVNDSELERDSESIVLNRTFISAKTLIPGDKLPVISLNGNSIPSQADDLNNDGSWDELAFQIDLEPNQSESITITFVDSADYPNFTKRTNAKIGELYDSEIVDRDELILAKDEIPVPLFTRFQMDGPAWENNNVGFRQYIDGRNGRDLYGKLTEEMALDTVGTTPTGKLADTYHVDRDWGRDILAVGNSLGLGGLAILDDGKPVRLGVTFQKDENNVDTTFVRILAEGPVRSILSFRYKGWDVNGRKINLANTVTIWSDSYGYYNTVAFWNQQKEETLLVGLVNIHNDNPPLEATSHNNNFSYFATHDRQTYEKQDYLGMGLIFENKFYQEYFEAPENGDNITQSYLLPFNLEPDETLTYKVIAGWEKSDSLFADIDQFEEYLRHEMEKMSNPIRIQ